MIKLIRIIAFIVTAVSIWSVYSRPEMREALFMFMDTDLEYYVSEYEEPDYEYEDGDGSGYEDGGDDY